MNNFLLGIASLLVLVLAALFAVPPMIDWNEFRGTFEEEASRLLDREVRVRGQVSVRILPMPYVSFEKVRIADAPGVAGSIARTQQFKMWLSVPPLLRGVFEARQIELDQPFIRLRTEPDGGGNWSKLKISEGNLQYLPSNVALNSVQINRGTLLFESHRGHEIAKLADITGEMTATSLNGPFKFAGTLPIENTVHSVRFSTAEMAENGEVRFSGSMRAPESGVEHSLNGTLSDLLGRVHATGRLVSRLRPARAKQSGDAHLRKAGYELTAKLKFDAESLRLDDIAISFRNQQRQQTLNGSAVASWVEGVATETNLSASWLDLDAIAGTGPADGPMKAFEQLMAQGVSPLGGGVTSVRLNIDQANLGGTSISNLRGRLVRRDGVTKIEGLRVSLPGRSALAIDGFVERSEGGLKYDGDILINSASFAEFARWARLDLGAEAEAGMAAPFSLRGTLRLRPRNVELSDAHIKFSDASVDGSVSYNWASRPALVADLESGTLQLAGFGDDWLKLDRVAQLLGLAGSAAKNRSANLLDGTDVALRLKAGELSDGTRRFANVDVDFGRTQEALNLKKFNLTWQPGLRLELAGRLKGIAKRPSGDISGLVSAAHEAAGARLVQLLNLTGAGQLKPQLLQGRLPIRLALTAKLRNSSTDSAAPDQSNIVLDGVVGDDRVRIDATTTGGVAGWLEQPVNVQARLTGTNALRSVKHLLGIKHEVKQAGEQADAAVVPATIVLAAVGTPSKQMKSFIRVDGGQLIDADFSGNFSIARAGNALGARWAGNLEIRQVTGRTLAALAWPKFQRHIESSPVQGRVAVAYDGSKGLSLRPRQLAFGAAVVSGDLTWNASASSINGGLQVSSIPLATLTGLVLRPGAAGQEPSLAERIASGPWPDARFDLGHLAGLRSDLNISVDAIPYDGGVMKGTSFKITGGAKKLAISKFSTRVAGARYKGSIELESRQAGVRLNANVTGSGIKLARWAPQLAEEDRLAGTASVNIKLNGQGLSPRSLATVMKGSGKIKLANAIVPGITAETVTTAARSAIAGDIEVEGLTELLAQNAGEGSILLGGPTLKLRIADGVLSLPSIRFALDKGQMRNATVVDLPRWALDSRWTVTPAPQPKPDAPEQTVALPPISLVYAGDIATVGEIVPTINLGDLERELIVRKMEANVARLERLRREDEERAAAELERQRQIEDERQRSIEAEKRRRDQSALPQEPQGEGTPINPPAPLPATGTQAPGQRSEAPSTAPQKASANASEAASPPPRRTRRRRPKKKPFRPFSTTN